MKSPSSLSERAESPRSHRADPGQFGGKLGDDVLLEICRIAPDDPENTASWRGELRRAVDLLASQDAAQHARLEDGLTLLTAALGRLAQCNPTLQPFGYSGPTIEAHGWIDDETLERVGKQIVGMIWPHSDADDVAVAVEHAVSEAVRLGFLEQRRYDAWSPGMPSGSGWSWAVSATPYGLMKARGAARREAEYVNDCRRGSTMDESSNDLSADLLDELRERFDAAVARLKEIPETELSPAGRPFIQECADAVKAFADWFGAQSPDDLAICGNAHRVQWALSGIRGVADWIALRWSVPFARELEADAETLFEQADRFNDAVVRAFRVPSDPDRLILVRKPLPEKTYAELDEGIQWTAALAQRIASRIYRAVIWASIPGGCSDMAGGNTDPSELADIAPFATRKTPDSPVGTSSETQATKPFTRQRDDAAIAKVHEHLSDTEANIIEALGDQRLIGEALAKQAGYPFNSNFKSTLSSLRKRGVLGNASPGYFVTAAWRRRADQGQDKGQD